MNTSQALLDKHAACLTEEDTAAAAKLRFERIRKRFILSRALIRKVLPLFLGKKHFTIQTEASGKPYIEANPVFFNLSHSGDKIALAIAKTPVGLDIEQMKARDFMALSVYKFGRHLDGVAFYREWTRLEASIKLFGGSVFEPCTKKAPYLHTEEWEGYMLSVASEYEIRLPLELVEIK